VPPVSPLTGGRHSPESESATVELVCGGAHRRVRSGERRAQGESRGHRSMSVLHLVWVYSISYSIMFLLILI
jgi:hypothetical protein